VQQGGKRSYSSKEIASQILVSEQNRAIFTER